MKKFFIIDRIIRHKKRISQLKDERSFDSASIGDMAFLLLIYFIVTSSFLLRQGIFLTLPSQNAASTHIDEKRLVEVQPKNDGFMYQGDNISRDDLVEQIKNRKAKIPDSVLIIVMKDNVRYERLVTTLSIAKETGIKRVSLKNNGVK